ncbi:MAG: hypothetical protein AAF830_16180 [Pseudomonadota bacterium]
MAKGTTLKSWMLSAVLAAGVVAQPMVASAAVTPLRYDAILQELRVACLLEGQLPQLIADARIEILEVPSQPLTDAQLAGIIGLIVTECDGLSAAALAEVLPELDILVSVITDETIQDTADIIVTTLTTGDDLDDDIIAELASPA